MNEKQLSILRKLVELACNNNSEHEANSAARTACKMIKNDEFKLLSSSSHIPHVPPVRPRQYQEPDFTDPFMNMYEEIRRRAREAASRESARQAEILERLRRERAAKEKEEREKKEKPKYTQKEDAPKWNWGYNPSQAQRDFFDASDASFYHRSNFRDKTNERPSIERECTKCHGKVRTFRVMEEPFICNVCQWNHWEAERESK